MFEVIVVLWGGDGYKGLSFIMMFFEIEEIFNDFDNCVCVLLIDYFFEEVVRCIDGCLILIILDEVWVYLKMFVFL